MHARTPARPHARRLVVLIVGLAAFVFAAQPAPADPTLADDFLAAYSSTTQDNENADLTNDTQGDDGITCGVFPRDTNDNKGAGSGNGSATFRQVHIHAADEAKLQVECDTRDRDETFNFNVQIQYQFFAEGDWINLGGPIICPPQTAVGFGDPLDMWAGAMSVPGQCDPLKVHALDVGRIHRAEITVTAPGLNQTSYTIPWISRVPRCDDFLTEGQCPDGT